MGDSDKAHDIAQMDSSEPPPTSEQPAATIDGLFGTAEAEGDDVFAQLVEVEGDGHEQEQTQPDLVQEPYSETHPPDVPKEAMLDTFQPQKGVKDYSDLLADFEAESDPPGQIQDQSVDQSDAYNHSAILPSEAETDNAADLLGLGQQDEGDLVGDQPKETGHQVTAAHQPSPLPAPALLLQEQSDEPSPIDDLIAQHDTIPQEPTAESMPAESPVPNLSIEHSQHDPGLAGVTDKAASDISMQSLFSNASDWLADTTMDDSFQVNGEHERHTVFAEDKLDRAEDPQEVAPFEVPQGWYDEQGNWQWYTDEEKEQVRLTMLGAGGSMGEEAKIGRPDEHQHDYQAEVPYSPAVYTGISENLARRTPQPEQLAVIPEPLPFDPYGLQSIQSPVSSSSASYGGFSGPSSAYIDRPSSYAAPVPIQPSPQPTQPYDPYAPAPQPYASQYATQQSVPGFVPARAGPSDPPPAAAAKPAPPKRMVSNAYDPPFLKPQKSFARSASAISMVAPAFAAPSNSISSAQIAQPAAPPVGPPRRPTTGQRPPSPGPSYTANPQTGQARRGSSASIAGSSTGPNNSYGPSLSPTQDKYERSAETNRYSSASDLPQASHRPSFSGSTRGGPQRTASYAAFDPPFRPASTSGRPPHMTPAARTHTPPILAFSPPLDDHGYARPQSPVRAPPRNASPMFEARPPSRALNQPDLSSRPVDRRGFGPPSSRDEGMGYDQPQDAFRPEHQSQTSRVPREEPEADSSAYGRSANHELQPRDRGYEDFRPPPTDEYQRSPHRMPYEHPATDLLPDQSSTMSGLGLDQIVSPPQSLPLRPPYDQYASNNNGYDDSASYPPYENLPPTSQVIPLSDHGQSYVPESSYAANPYVPTSSYEPTSYPLPSSYEPATYAPSTQPNGEPYGQITFPSYINECGASPPEPGYSQSTSVQDDTYIPQLVLEQRPVSEDPLGRSTTAARNIPLAVFGFGGILVTAFPATAEDSALGHSPSPSYGYASGRGQLWLRKVPDIVEDGALNADSAKFPGPLVLDPSLPKGAAGDKKKREEIMAYLILRAEEIEKGLPYLKSSASRARREEEGKLVLFRLLAAMIIGDGKLSGSPRVDDAVRSALQNPSLGPDPSSLSARKPNSPTNTYGSLYPPAPSRTAAPATASPGQLAQLSAMLLNGDKREATQYAASAGLWSHALVISSCVDQELWKEIVSRFASAELEGGVPGTSAMKASYALFSGLTLTSVDDLLAAASITDDPSSDHWREVISAVVFNGKPAELSCLDELSDRLMEAGLVNAAYACSLLSPSSPFADHTPAAFDRTISFTRNPRDEDAAIFAEIAEYARSLVLLPKGQEAVFPGLPQLLPYKLHRAWRAAELGDTDQAQRYCSAVEAASKPIKNGPPLMPRAFLASLEDLLERLTGTPSANPANIFGGRKPAKPGFDKLGSWIEGRLTKFIAGEEDANSAPAKPAAAPPAKGSSQAPVGPFSHFSTISPGASGQVSRATSIADFHNQNGHLDVQPDSRRTSPRVLSQAQFGAEHTREPSSSSSSYGEQCASQDGAPSGFAPWGLSRNPSQIYADRLDDDTPQGEPSEDHGLLNPMAHLSLASGRDGPSPSSYEPKRPSGGDDDEDLGFGNTSLSRSRTPRPSGEAGAEDRPGTAETKTGDGQKSKAGAAIDASPSKAEGKGSWLGRWWGKKEGEPSGPIRAKLGEESSMVFDKDLKRWVVKGAKGDAAIPAPPPAPPRFSTASPSQLMRPESNPSRAMSSTPPPSQLARNSVPPSGPPGGVLRTSNVTASFAETADGGIKRMKSSLADSLTPDSSSSGAAPAPPPLGSQTSTAASLDDLLSRPPSKRPSSAAAKKGAKNRYVDILKPGTEGS